MGWPKLLVLVRHAESEGNVRTAEERAAYEVPTHKYELTGRGRRQAALTGLWLRGAYGDFDVRYTSYYRRAQETMLIMRGPREKVYEDPRLREAERGIWATHTQEQIARLYRARSNARRVKASTITARSAARTGPTSRNASTASSARSPAIATARKC